MKKGLAKSSSRRSPSPKLVKTKTKHDEIYWGRWSRKKTWLYPHKVVVLWKNDAMKAEIRDWYAVPCIPEKCTNKKRQHSCRFRHNDGSSGFEFQIMDGTLAEAKSCAAGFNGGVVMERPVLEQTVKTRLADDEKRQATDSAFVIGLEKAFRFQRMPAQLRNKTRDDELEVAFRPPPAHVEDPPKTKWLHQRMNCLNI